jgi:hypothetical protein
MKNTDKGGTKKWHFPDCWYSYRQTEAHRRLKTQGLLRTNSILGAFEEARVLMIQSFINFEYMGRLFCYMVATVWSQCK